MSALTHGCTSGGLRGLVSSSDASSSSKMHGQLGLAEDARLRSCPEP